MQKKTLFALNDENLKNKERWPSGLRRMLGKHVYV